MEKQYVGIKSGGFNCFKSSNLGEIFTLEEDGNYHGSNLILTPDQIKHDLFLNYLEPYRN